MKKGTVEATSESPAALDIPREDVQEEEEQVSAMHVEESGAVPFDSYKVMK